MSGFGYDFGSSTGAIPRITPETVDPRVGGRHGGSAPAAPGEVRHGAPPQRPLSPPPMGPPSNLLLVDPDTQIGSVAKFLVPFGIAVLISVQQMIAGPVVLASALTCLVAVVTAALVWIVPQLKRGPKSASKVALAVLGAAGQAAIGLATAGITPSEWITVALAGLAAFGVGAVPNTRALPAAARRPPR